MTINLSEITFSSDAFSTVLPSGDTLLINKVDESIDYNGTTVSVNCINIQVTLFDSGEVIKCPSVIGIGNDILTIETSYTEYEGKVLTTDNLSYCTLEVNDE